jgi:hypothetical protein
VFNAIVSQASSMMSLQYSPGSLKLQGTRGIILFFTAFRLAIQCIFICPDLTNRAQLVQSFPENPKLQGRPKSASLEGIEAQGAF